MVSLEGMHEIGDVQAPDEGGEAATLGQALEDRDVDISIGETMEDVVLEKVVLEVCDLGSMRRKAFNAA